MPFKSNSSLAWILLLFLSIVWGSSFILIKKALITFDPLQVATTRIGFSFLAFSPLLIKFWDKIEKKHIKPLLIVGICGSGFPAFLYAIGQTNIPSAVAGVLNSMTPVFTLILSIIIFKQAFKSNQLYGILLGLAGILTLFFMKNEGESVSLFHASLIIIATICYAISANTVGNYLNKVNPLLISVVSFTVIGPPAILYLFSTEFITQAFQNQQSINSFGALLILSLVCTFLANILFFKLVQITNAVFSTTVSFLIPFVALFWGFLDGESIGIFHFVALFSILLGILLIRKK